ncbi:hypothetical protein KIN20_008622 [Parelaphostrongylus tenuis]|uniref:Uncharacterized protein n=1 Tax=Parelaphostrongylus tenuis TaxID=148309 RepID=A0AAD5MPA9_PARTN|nr:hypothetical protein KIN20_008622 [Parelaphostrongylus tenuis]
MQRSAAHLSHQSLNSLSSPPIRANLDSEPECEYDARVPFDEEYSSDYSHRPVSEDGVYTTDEENDKKNPQRDVNHRQHMPTKSSKAASKTKSSFTSSGSFHSSKRRYDFAPHHKLSDRTVEVVSYYDSDFNRNKMCDTHEQHVVRESERAMNRNELYDDAHERCMIREPQRAVNRNELYEQGTP